jgi:NAD(P)-dependent dehydrogenase (short-subunit alcohol dehydrogenase family)
VSAPQKVAVVTGGGRGIGRACAERLSRAGFAVAVGGRSRKHLDETTRAIVEAGGRALAVDLDVADEASVLRAFETVRAELGPAAVLVNNAGIALAAPLQKTSTEDFRRTLEVNLTGAFLCTRAVLPEMLAAGWGRVINVASTAARMGFRYTAAYCASKHGLLGMTRALALEVAKRGITVNAVCPGWTETEMLGASIANISAATGQSAEQARAALAHMNPMGRIIQPAEVAELVAYVASEAAGAVTGQALGVDGGEAM